MNNPTLVSKNIKRSICNDERFTIVFYGDSDTSTEWIHPNWRNIIEYVLKSEMEEYDAPVLGKGLWNFAWWNIHFINSGLDGATTSDFLARAQEDVLRYEPNMVIYVGGGNDIDKFSPKEHGDNSAQLATLLTEQVPYVYMSTCVRTAHDNHNQKCAPYRDAFRASITTSATHTIDLI